MFSRRPAMSPSLACHALAIFWLGVMAGFFWTYSANVNFATLEMDGATYARVQSGLNRNVRHAMFFGFFFGPPLLCALALATAWSARHRGWWRCLLLAGVLYGLGIVVFTAQVNLPLNAYTESWDPRALPPDWARTRERWCLNGDMSKAELPEGWGTSQVTVQGTLGPKGRYGNLGSCTRVLTVTRLLSVDAMRNRK